MTKKSTDVQGRDLGTTPDLNILNPESLRDLDL